MNTSIRKVLAVIALVLVAAGLGVGIGFLRDKSGGGDSSTMNNATTYESGPFRVTISVNPSAPRVGKNQLTVKVADAQGDPVSGASIKAFGEMPAMGAMSAMRAPADLEEREPGMYAGPLALEMRGEWPLSLSIEKDGIGETRLGFDMATGRTGLAISSGGRPVRGAESRTETMAGGSAPTKDESGFYTVGNYKVKVDVLGQTDAMTASSKEQMADSTAMMAGRNRLQVTVLGADDEPLSGANVRVAAQRESSAKTAMSDSMKTRGSGMSMQSDMSGSAERRDGDAMAMKPSGDSAGDMSSMAGEQHIDAMAMQDTDSPRNSEVATLRDVGDGVYEGQLKVPGDGDYVLAVDVSTEQGGHGDLVLAFTTGQYGLQAANATAEGVAYYTCSMHPSVREAGPGQCPICSMNLSPVSNEQIASGEITIDAKRRQMIGVKTGTAEVRALSKTIRAVGEVAFDERRVSNVTLKFDAWIGDLKADFVGTHVDKGQTLFSVYSPELLSAQQEYLESRRRLADRGPDDSLVAAARRRLMLWDISPAQVRALERRGEPLEYLPITAPASGTVVEKMINEGSAMKRGDMLLRIADLSTVWIDAEVYEADLPLIKPGMSATVSLPYQAGAAFEATVDYIYPYLTGGTRTARVRLVLDNPDGVLKPDMFAEVRLNVDLGRRLVVPSEAVLIAGESRVVFKDLGDEGKLKPVRVKTGQRVGDWVEITAGLSPGDTVVTSGNFLIASEAKLKTGIEQW